MLAQRRLLAFVVRVLVMVVLLAPAWPFLSPGYTRLLVAACNVVAPSSITMRAVDSSIIIFSVEQGASISISSLPFQAGLFLVVILIIATPGLKIWKRLKYTVAAIFLTFGIHIVVVLGMGIQARALRPVIVLLGSIGADLFPILIWAILCAKYWWPRREAEETEVS